VRPETASGERTTAPPSRSNIDFNMTALLERQMSTYRHLLSI